MRKILFSLLLATTMATPALAADRPHGDRSGSPDQPRSERSESQQDRSKARQDRAEAREAREARSNAREERVQLRDNGDHVAQRPVQMGVNRFQSDDRQPQLRREAARDSRRDNVNDRGRPTLDRHDNADSVANWRRQRDGHDSNWRDNRTNRDTASNWRDRRDDRVRIPVGARPDRPAPLPQTAYNHHDRTPNWDRDWRHHSRYDWRRYRDHHRSTFHLGAYFDPFGWGYRRYNVGWRLWPNYYSSNYWLNDPSMYALPYAPYPYKWVRYYDDALLVNTFTGQVVDVMYDFFW